VKKCDYTCCKKGDFNKHLQSKKHNTTNTTNIQPIVAHICLCGKVYNHRASLYNHKKKCDYDENKIIESKQITTIDPIDHASLTEKMIELVMSKNQEFMNVFMEKIVHILPSVTNNNTTNIQNFNIQMFLNEHCKNAMNLTDFIDSLPITAATYDSTIENGLTKTLTNMITNGLSKLDILDRPIHCTDATRKTIYVKEENNWEKDTELLRILLGIKTIARKQRMLINKWQDANEGWEKEDYIQTKLTTLISHSMTNIESDEKETSKIVRAISKNVYLDNETKQQYLC